MEILLRKAVFGFFGVRKRVPNPKTRVFLSSISIADRLLGICPPIKTINGSISVKKWKRRSAMAGRAYRAYFRRFRARFSLLFHSVRNTALASSPGATRHARGRRLAATGALGFAEGRGAGAGPGRDPVRNSSC